MVQDFWRSVYIVYRILISPMKMKNTSLMNGVIVTVFSATLNLMPKDKQCFLNNLDYKIHEKIIDIYCNFIIVDLKGGAFCKL